MQAPSLPKELDQHQVIESIKQAIHLIWDHVRRNEDWEVVGAVLSDGGTVPLINSHLDPKSNFAVDSTELENIEDVVAIYHSHPLGQEIPTITDERGLAPIPAVIVTPTGIILWWHNESIGYYRIWDWYGPE